MATVGPFREAAGGSSWGRVLVVLVVAAIAMQGVAFLAAARLRRSCAAADADKNRRLVSECPFCRRGVKYPAFKGGTGFVCPKCRTAFVLPEAVGA